MTFFDDLETRDPNDREATLFAALPAHLERARRAAPAMARRLGGIETAGMANREAVARIPGLRESELRDLQRREPPFGGFESREGDLAHVFASPGPLYEPAGEGDFASFARPLFAAGFRRGELLYNTFS